MARDRFAPSVCERVFPVHVDPLEHFLQFGAGELREPFHPASSSPGTASTTSTTCSTIRTLRPRASILSRTSRPFGWREGRDPNALFDVSGYLATYTDVAAANVNPLDHYDQFGWHEGRDPSVDFNTTAYLAAYPDVAAAGYQSA